ncbi:MAG: hypothetical protein ACM3NQ_04285 [Bacteroidales bacterium]
MAARRNVEIVKPGKRVVLVGFANSKECVPWDEKPDEVWGINDLWNWFGAESQRYWTRWFEIHPRDTIGLVNESHEPRQGGEADRAKHLAWLRGQPVGKPIYMQEAYPDIPASVAFPLEALIAKFERRCPAYRRYFTSSIGMMLALAIAEGRDDDFRPLPDQDHFDRIDIYGIDLAGDTEYQYQRPNAEWFAGFASGLGITVTCHPDSAMFKGECIYAYERTPAEQGPLTLSYFVKQKADLAKQMEQQQEIAAKANATINTLHGAHQMCEMSIKMLTAAKRGVREQNLVRTVVR